MKKTLLSTLFILFTFIGYSQYKGNPNKAQSLLNKTELKSSVEEIRKLLIDAKGEIDLAITIDKQKSRVQTWYIRGQVYDAISRGFLDIDNNAINKAVEAYNKIGAEIKTNNAEIISNTFTKKNNLSLYFAQKAIGYQQSNTPDFESALKEWKNVLLIYPDDTLATLYSGYVAENISNYEYAIEKYNKVIKSENFSLKNKKIALQNSTSILFNQCEIFNDCSSYSEALNVINIGLELFPENNFFKQVEINILIFTDKVNEAIDKTNELIKSDPNNASLYYNKGIFYYNMANAISDNIKDYKFTDDDLILIDSIYNVSIDSYKKSIELDPSNLTAMKLLINTYNLSAEPYIKMRNFLEYDVLGIKEFTKKQNDLSYNIKSRTSRGVDVLKYVIDNSEVLNQQDILSLYAMLKFSENYDLAIQFLNKVTSGDYWEEGIDYDYSSVDFLDYLRESYGLLKDYDNQEKIEKIICEKTDGSWSDQYGCE